MSLLGHLSVLSFRIRRNLHALALKRLARSDTAWRALDAAQIPGFGTHLVRLDFPLVVGQPPAWGHGRPSQPQLAQLLESRAEALERNARQALEFIPELADLPLHAASGSPLAWLNGFQSPLDLAFGYGLLRARGIHRYVEIGCGISTHLAARTRRASQQLEIFCVDPQPRFEITALANRVDRVRLEENIPAIVAATGPGTALFFDGSHFAFPNSDVTRFFLDVLPQVRPGTLVHIHDVYLPDDYPARHLHRLWNEQYLLAAWLLGGSARVQPILPGHWLADRIQRDGLDAWMTQTPETFRAAHQTESDASCWWMEIT